MKPILMRCITTSVVIGVVLCTAAAGQSDAELEVPILRVCEPEDPVCIREIFRSLFVERLAIEFRVPEPVAAGAARVTDTVTAAAGGVDSDPLSKECKNRITVVVHGVPGSTGTVTCGSATATCVVAANNTCSGTARAPRSKQAGTCTVGATSGAAATAHCTYIDP